MSPGQTPGHRPNLTRRPGLGHPDDAPAGLRPPTLAIEGSALCLGPDLLKCGQAVTVSLLVDGTKPTVTVPEPPFIDIAIRELPGENSPVMSE